MKWSRKLAQQLKAELSPRACEIVDEFAAHPDRRFSTSELVERLSLKNARALRALLGKTTEAAKRIGVAQDEPHSWFVQWQDKPEWRYWLDSKRATMWLGGNLWARDELKASVEAYIDMLRLHRSGKPFVKKDYYRTLEKRFGRTEKAYEYRAQNISRVLELQGREWLPGLLPARNIGLRVTAVLEQLIADCEGTQNSHAATFEAEVRAALRKRPAKPPGNPTPPRQKGLATSYGRDREVQAWVLAEANGRCESCCQEAPFRNADGAPFLEVHHVRQLADGGPDTTDNAVAVCPNCHRALHFATDREKRKRQLYERLERLVGGYPA